MFNTQRSIKNIVCLCIAAVSAAPLAVTQAPTSKHDDHSGWQQYGGASDGAQYSSLTQINRSNVKDLKQAWAFRTGDNRGYIFNPLVVEGTMYVLARKDTIVALDAATGAEKWARAINAKTTLLPTRGLTYWQSKDGKDHRLIFAADNMLQEIDARTGDSIKHFGKDGRVDLREGLGRDPNTITMVQSYNPGRVIDDLIVLGSMTNAEYDSGPGDIRAYNILTGKLAWTFHTIPHPGEVGYETWPKDAWKTAGGANAWNGMALDEKRGIIYVPTASPKYNFYGANRTGNNLFGDSLLAIDARTGKLIWYYQMVHHDIWDYDNANTPMLLTVKHDGKMVDVVAQSSKTGFLWVFDRVTGKPLWPIQERPVPKSSMPGEVTSATQPFPTKPAPFARQKFTVDELSPYLEPEEREQLRKQMLAAHNDGLFTPPGLEDTVEMPGNNGGANFGGAAVDPAKGYMYVVSKDLPAMLKLTLAKTAIAGGSAEDHGKSVFAANCALCHGENRAGNPPAIPALTDVTTRLSGDQIKTIVHSGKNLMPAFAKLGDGEVDDLLKYLSHPEKASTSTAATATDVSGDPAQLHYKSSFGFMFSNSGLPAIAPPWTTLTAYDLNSGEIRWKIPLGEVPELAANGAKDTGSHFPKVGPVVTAGGLIFTGTRDRKVRALDANTGKVLWEQEVGAALEGMPAIYEISGKQYVVFCAAARATTHTHAIPGHPASQDPIDGAYIAFALDSIAKTKK